MKVSKAARLICPSSTHGADRLVAPLPRNALRYQIDLKGSDILKPQSLWRCTLLGAVPLRALMARLIIDWADVDDIDLLPLESAFMS